MATAGDALVADIGGTNARFAICRPGERPAPAVTRACADFATLDAAAADALAELSATPAQAALAVAGPVVSGAVRMTNHSWTIDAVAFAQAFGLDRCLLVNDFAGIAWSLPHLAAADLRHLGGGSGLADAACAVLGPGTGLGIAGLAPSGGDWVVIAGEGGHAGFAPVGDEERQVLAHLSAGGAHVSREDILSGPGLVRLAGALAALHGDRFAATQPQDLSTAATADPNGVAARAVSMFSHILGGVAGDVALTLGARRGVFIAGGVVPALGDLFDADGFRQRFEAKGRFRDYLAAIPANLINEPCPALIGLSALLANNT